MTSSKIIPPVFLVHREPVEDLLQHQVWADAQLRRQVRLAQRCVDRVLDGKLTPAGARAKLTRLARTMHEAIREFGRLTRTALKPVTVEKPVLSQPRVTVPYHQPAQPQTSNWRQWQWQATNPVLGCLALEAFDWNQQSSAAELWIQRSVHRALTIRAAGEYLAVRLDGLDAARKTLADARKQLDYATKDFWSRFTLAESIGFRECCRN